jgi:Bacterial regulatory proteins, luxR family
VLALVAEGRTNRQIGQELFITPKTAGVHVSRILAKLGVAVAGKRPRWSTGSVSTSNGVRSALADLPPARFGEIRAGRAHLNHPRSGHSLLTQPASRQQVK